MRGKEVFDVLNQIGVTHLHHANSVTTRAAKANNLGVSEWIRSTLLSDLEG